MGYFRYGDLRDKLGDPVLPECRMKESFVTVARHGVKLILHVSN